MSEIDSNWNLEDVNKTQLGMIETTKSGMEGEPR